jgi:hypothetical protein
VLEKPGDQSPTKVSAISSKVNSDCAFAAPTTRVPGVRGIHNVSPHALEMSVQPKRTEDIARFLVSVALRFQRLDVRLGGCLDIDVRSEPGHHRERCARVRYRLGDAPGALNLVDLAVEDDHLAVQIGERANSEVAVV